MYRVLDRWCALRNVEFLARDKVCSPIESCTRMLSVLVGVTVLHSCTREDVITGKKV